MTQSKLSLRVTQASLNQTALDWPQNMANHYAAIDVAVGEGSDMVLMPELSITGYEVNDDFQRTDNNRIYDALCSVADYAYHKDPNLLVSVGNPWRVQLREAFDKVSPHPDLVKNPLYDRLNLPFNVQTLIGGGRILGMTAKANLFRDERGYENRYFNEWSISAAEGIARLMGVDGTYGTLPIQLLTNETIPFGRPQYFITDSSGHSYVHATAICEEKWVATRYDGHPNNDSWYDQLSIIPSIGRYLGTTSGVLLEIANASPPTWLKNDKHTYLNNLASEYADVVIDTDGLGTSGATFSQFGHRNISQGGKIISTGQRITFGQGATTTSTVRIAQADPALEQKTHKSVYRDFQNVNAPQDTGFAFRTREGAWDNPENSDRWKEEYIRNQALWMFDYMRKTGARGIMEALSGGKDSSFNCAMVRVMVELAMSDLGVEGFCEQMSHLPYKDKILQVYKGGGKETAVEVCMENMLTAVYMGTNNSSFETWNAAKTLIDGGEFEDSDKFFKGIGGKFVERNVQDLLDFYAYIFAVSNSTEVPREKKLEVMEDLAEFLNANPHDHTPDEMDAWETRLFKKYPEVQQLVSAAKPGHGLGYENIQARGREVLIMLFANIEGKMPVANPNLDEAYGAYATFGGDLHSGTVNWNAGLHKVDQEALMEYLEEKGVQGVMDRIIALAPANNNRPSAELQPKKDGEVSQFDEDALQGTFPQKAALARLRHHTKIHTADGSRWMNAGELFNHAREDNLFNPLDDNQLFNSVAYFYQRWEGPAQHKIHATPLAPTMGENVDKQTSLRTPNLSGDSKDEIVALGINLMFKWAEEDQISLDGFDDLHRRAWQDKTFASSFVSQAKNQGDDKDVMTYDLRALYNRVKENGWDKTFPKPQTTYSQKTWNIG